MIVLRAKKVDFEVTYIDLRNKPDWFLEISPHGKVPVLLVDDDPLFESNAIAEFLDEVVEPQLHPKDAKKRARNRAWTDFVPDFSKALSSITYAKSKEAIEEAVEAAPKRLDRVEQALAKERGNDGPYFNGPDISLVDASYAPFFQRFAILEELLETGLLKDYPLIQAWSDALLADEIITGSVAPEFLGAMAAGLKRREAYAAPLMEQKMAAE